MSIAFFLVFSSLEYKSLHKIKDSHENTPKTFRQPSQNEAQPLFKLPYVFLPLEALPDFITVHCVFYKPTRELKHNLAKHIQETHA